MESHRITTTAHDCPPRVPNIKTTSSIHQRTKVPALARTIAYTTRGPHTRRSNFRPNGIRRAVSSIRKSYDPSCERDRLAGPEFTIPLGLDPALGGLVLGILKMGTHYVSIEAFLEVQGQRDSGSVCHALCAGIRRRLQEYLVLVVQLETQVLTNPEVTLNVLNLYTLSAAHMLKQIYALGREISNQSSFDMEDDTDKEIDDFDNILEGLRAGGDLTSANILSRRLHKGGKLLRLLTTRLDTLSGDPAALTLLTSLLKDASRPYMSMLNSWLHHGIIKDPHGEFLVREQKNINRETLPQDYTDEYWDRRYILREDTIPPQLEPFKDKILLAGKYLNVVRECGGMDSSELMIADLPQSFDDERFVRNINNAYTHANESLLRLLLTTHALPARLRLVKQYFMLDRSYLFTSLLELGASELRKPVQKINLSKVQSLLDLVLHQPGADPDPFRDDLRVEMNPTSLVESLTRVVSISGMEEEPLPESALNPHPRESKIDNHVATGFSSLQLDYRPPFPVSLVISRKTIWRYQALFRFLLSLRYLERQLLGSWQAQKTYSCSDREVQVLQRRTFILRARMLSFVQQLIYFCTEEVIEVNWGVFMAKLEGDEMMVGTVDELMQDHVDFLDSCLKGCMLTNSKLLRFTSFTEKLSKELETLDLQEHKRRFENLHDLLQKFETGFSRGLNGFVDALNHFAATETPGFLGLCARLSMLNPNQGAKGSGGREEGDEKE
ncbi:spindle pole body component alp4 protein [Rutstroemia sp. NJR-2017a WRK4]|nr:spindle pole body component alp4 protein [Rutstroemia sp. NJR-2017a WRK4]